MEKIKKLFSLIVMIIFLCQNSAFCVMDEKPTLRPPLKSNDLFGEAIIVSMRPYVKKSLEQMHFFNIDLSTFLSLRESSEQIIKFDNSCSDTFISEWKKFIIDQLALTMLLGDYICDGTKSVTFKLREGFEISVSTDGLFSAIVEIGKKYPDFDVPASIAEEIHHCLLIFQE